MHVLTTSCHQVSRTSSAIPRDSIDESVGMVAETTPTEWWWYSKSAYLDNCVRRHLTALLWMPCTTLIMFTRENIPALVKESHAATFAQLSFVTSSRTL